ncbi:hypothetical protein [Pollutibacter soli]|uniref:hypothetical protein n=1 Tax=Pollutibacter soli TaxID=3034157 RepID=UPI003013DA38
MREPSIFYMQTLHWKSIVQEIMDKGDQNLKDTITILPVRDPDFNHYLVVSLSDTGDEIFQKLGGTLLENQGLKERISALPKKPLFGKKENLDYIK